MKIIIANTNTILRQVAEICKNELHATLINTNDELTFEFLDKEKPDYIFFLHWSNIIPKNIWSNFRCIVFHMTDLPFGRGGSPLQNLIIRKHTDTMISALKVEGGIDTGDVFLKKSLSLSGTAEEIFIRAGWVMLQMIKEIIEGEIVPTRQEGQPTIFKRRTPEDGNLQSISDVSTLYDYIRMLDAEGYPKAFIETDSFRFEFSRASMKADGVIADVKIIKKINRS